MKTIKIDSLKLYKNKLETYIPDLLETATESDIDGLMQDLHQYKICIFPKTFSYGHTNAMCRLNIHRKTGKATITALKSKLNTDCTAVFDDKYTLHFYTPSRLWNGQFAPNGYLYPSGSFNYTEYSVESVLEGVGQCLGGEGSPNKYYMEMEISSLDRIEFFPSWNAYGWFSEHFGSRYSTAVTVDVECDGEKVFSGTISDLKIYDRVKIVFDSFNKVHLEKFNVGTASAFEDYY